MSVSHEANQAPYDWVFRNCTIFDGSGATPFSGEVAVRGDRIVSVTDLETLPSGAGRQEVNLVGLALAPGFIDAHTHDDRMVIDSPEMLPKISQGVTSVVVGNC